MGTVAFFPELLGVRKAALDLLHECGAPFELAQDEVVIGMHQGYNFLYLQAGTTDPAVWRYMEGDRQPVQVAEHFTELVIRALAEGG